MSSAERSRTSRESDDFSLSTTCITQHRVNNVFWKNVIVQGCEEKKCTNLVLMISRLAPDLRTAERLTNGSANDCLANSGPI